MSCLILNSPAIWWSLFLVFSQLHRQSHQTENRLRDSRQWAWACAMYHCIKRRSWSTRAVFVLPACVTGVTRALPVTLETVQPLRTDALLAALARVSRLTQTLSAHMIALGTVHTATRLSAAHTVRAHRTLILAPAHTHTFQSQISAVVLKMLNNLMSFWFRKALKIDTMYKVTVGIQCFLKQ